MEFFFNMIRTTKAGYAVFLCLMFCLLAAPSSAFAEGKPTVVFLNPAAAGDVFFQRMTDFMQAAANDLGFDLEVHYGNRNHVLIDDNITTVFANEELPDYIIGMNARGSGERLLGLAELHNVPLVIINQGFLGEDKLAAGKPGVRYTQWLFEFLPDDTHAGYLLARKLIAAAKAQGLTDADGFINIIGVSGQKISSASVLREQGLREAVSEDPKTRLLQIVHADWKKDKAHQQVKRLLERYPDTAVIWSASDKMAFGVVDALLGAGRMSGKDVLTGGVDWAEEALDRIEAGTFTTSIGGHFMDGAWALVMLYDMVNGADAHRPGQSHFSAITSENIAAFRNHFAAGNWEIIDFTRFSMHDNPALKAYDFSLEAVLEQVREN